MKNGTAKRGRQEDRFGAGQSREADAVAEALGAPGRAGERAGPSQDEIAQRAYEKYLTRGGSDGHHEDDWLAAEEELRQERGRP